MSASKTTYDPNNIFAKILRGEIPCKKVYEDDYVLAFYDIVPISPVHVLVIPKNPYVSFADFTANAKPEEIVCFMKAVGKIAKDLGIEEDGYRLVTNIGKNSGQEVPHFHVHILGGRQFGPLG